MAEITNITMKLGEQQTHVSEHGSISITGPQGIERFRIITIKHGLEAELHGFRLTSKAPPCFRIIKEQYGIKVNNRDKYPAYVTFCEQYGLEAKPRDSFPSKK